VAATEPAPIAGRTATPWVTRLLGKYIVWDPTTLLVPARPELGRPAEQLVYSERRHLVALLADAWPELLAATVGPLLLVELTRGDTQVVFGVLLFVLQVRLLWKIVEWAIARIMITDKRVIEFGGFLRRNGGSMPLGKLTDLSYHQSFPGLLLDYGMVRIESAGQDQALSRIRYLRYPVAFQQELVARAVK
jgi:uncharacterized membrane protein YdbT with pleckstrin-like domain